MSSNFKNTFGLNPKYNSQKEKRLKEILYDCLTRDRPNLIRYENDLLVSEPFSAFWGDCEFCKYYVDSECGYVTGGECSLKNIRCGYGFTCRSYEMSHNTKECLKKYGELKEIYGE